MAGTVIADKVEAASTSQLVIKNGVANTPPTIQDSAGTEVGTLCRAWVNFNGTGTVAIRASFNVSSITDNGVGDYTVNFTNAMPDANYGFGGVAEATSATATAILMKNFDFALTVSALRIRVINGSSVFSDVAYVSLSVFR